MQVAENIKRKALGKGLESLLPARRVTPPPPPPAVEVSAAGDGTPREIPVDMIDRNPYQTRSHFDEAQLVELAASIASTGVVQPILVRPIGNGRFQLVAGERRWTASQRAGKLTVPAVVRSVSDQQAMEMTVVENLQRADLNPMEQARAFERLSRDFQLTQEQIAKRTGKDRTSIANSLRLLKLPKEVQSKVETGELSFGHARTLLSLESGDLIQKAAQKVLALALSVRQTESYVQNLLNPEKEQKSPKLKEPLDPNVREARDLLQRALGLKVVIEDKGGRGKVTIEYSNLEGFDALMMRIVGDEG